MCNGTSTRTSQGGTIAVLARTRCSSTSPSICSSPSSISSSTTSTEEILLTFHNTFSHLGTSVSLQGLDDDEDDSDQASEAEGRERRERARWLVIHRDGDLTQSITTQTHTDTTPLYTFPLDAALGEMQLAERLQLGVGEKGVVGRRVSVMMMGSKEGAVTLAEGVMGWN